MRVLLLIFSILFLCPGQALAKKKKKRKYTTQDIVWNADSLLRAKMGDSLFLHCKIEKGSYYSYRKGKKLIFKDFSVQEKLPKKFDKAFMHYSFVMPWGECPLYDTVSGYLNFQVQKGDSVFSFASEPDAGFIPQMAIEHIPCGFITERQALDIALSDTLIRGVTPPYATLEYVPAVKKFRWVVFSLTWNERDHNNDKESYKDIVVIDAETGEVLQHKKKPYIADIEEITTAGE